MCYDKLFIKNKVYPRNRCGFDRPYLEVPCSSCPSCRKQRANDWFVRTYFELKYSTFPYVYFLTLDFDNEHLPRYRNVPCFDTEVMKHFFYRLRGYIGAFRYFYVTEYGGFLRRPHYHVILFTDFPGKYEE